MKLKKIKLINWHVFSNETIEVKGNMLVTGENGTGKSTFIDALYYCITGGDSKNFNNAAQEKGKRDLEGYIRGKTGKEGQAYLRNESSVISHIALEFLDNTGTSMVLGVVLELSSNLDAKFYTVNKYNIDDNDYIKDGKALSYNELKANLKLKNLEPNKLDRSPNKRRTQIGKDIFKLDNYKRYYDLLKSAVGFRAITEVSSFVNDFLLEEDTIDLNNIKDEIRSYKEIKNLLNKEEAKIQLLEPFIPKANKYVDNLKKIEYLDVLKAHSDIEDLEGKIQNKNLAILRLDNEIEELKDKIASQNEIKMSAMSEKRDLENNEDYKALISKKEEVRRLEKEISLNNKYLNDFKLSLKSECNIIKSLSLSYKLMDDFKEENYPLLKAHLDRYAKELDDLKEKLYDEGRDLEAQLRLNDKQKSQKEFELETLMNGKNNYDNKVISLIEVIEAEIKAKYPKEKKISVKPLCELLEIADKKWTNAIEGYLNTQRFDLIVDSKFYDVAAKAYNDYKDAREIYGVGLINVKKIKPQKAEKNSLYQMLEHKHGDADRVAEMILGRVIAVDSLDELKNYDIAITPDVMIYKNHTLRACNKEIYSKPFIGEDSVVKRKMLLENEIEELNKKILELRALIDENKRLKFIANSSNVSYLVRFDNYWSKLENLNNTKASYEADIDALSKSKGFIGIDERIKACIIKIEEASRLVDKANDEKDSANKKKGGYENDISSLSLQIDEANIRYNDLYSKISNLGEYEDFALGYHSERNLDAEKIRSELESRNNANYASKEYLIRIMQAYTSQFKQSMSPIIENITDYINEYNVLINRDVVKYQDKADETYKKAQKSFQEDFISKLYEKILKAKEMLKNLNKHLNNIPFGPDEERFKFTYTGSKDTDFAEYYRIITSGKDMKAQDLFTDVLDDKDQSIMKDLFDHISIEATTSEMEKDLERYLDYRNYMNYDIQTTDKYGEITYFSKVNKEKSGGETQTPFYVIIAACFDEIMNKEKGNSTAVVILDEAFNNMDEGRIESLMSFYKKLNIQFVVVVPSIRSTVIIPYVDSVYGIIKIRNRSKFIDYVG